MSVALNPSTWYSFLFTYKGAEPERGAALASLAYQFLSSNGQAIRAKLGGDIDVITIVPSKRGVTYSSQPLRRALALVGPIRDLLGHTLTHKPATKLAHTQYDSAIFEAGPDPVNGRRVALIEDTWITGATSLSAAGALLDLGAAAVLILPVAREVKTGWWEAKAPQYCAAAREPHTLEWPRG